LTLFSIILTFDWGFKASFAHDEAVFEASKLVISLKIVSVCDAERHKISSMSSSKTESVCRGSSDYSVDVHVLVVAAIASLLIDDDICLFLSDVVFLT
jgi:hypothetical protein